jgi:3-oxoacyl-(acyl-carrier-protein) synthase
MSLPGAAGGTEIVTGGTGGLGLLVGRWLAGRGMKTIVLASRSGKMGTAAPNEQSLLLASRAKVALFCCNSGESSAVSDLIAWSAALAPLSGVWHAAGVLSDGMLDKHNAQTMSSVYGPKAHGAALLQRATATAPLLRSLTFSSVTALMGGAGQTNYSAANCTLDSQAAYLRSTGQVGTAVQWGPWGEVGMASGAKIGNRFKATGLNPIGLSSGLRALQAAVQLDRPPVVACVPANWTKVVRNEIAVPAFLSAVAKKAKDAPSRARGSSTAGAARALVQGVASTPQGAPLELVMDIVQRAAGSAVDADMPIMSAGVDSLGTVELINQLQAAVGDAVRLPSTLAFDHPTGRAIAALVASATPAAPAATATEYQVAMMSDCQRSAESPTTLAHASALPPIKLAGTSCRLPGRINTIASLNALTSGGQAGAVDCAPHWYSDFLIDGAQLFDEKLFALSSNESKCIDPQQRHVLEKGYEALHASNFDRMGLGGRTTGVIVGLWCAYFGHAADIAGSASVYNAQNVSMSNVSGRLSFTLGLHGPCSTVDTACSSSLVASHQALRALQHVECEEHVVVGVNMIFADHFAAVSGMLSPNRRSYSFDKGADGYARGEACGAAVLHTSAVLYEAEICGSAVQQDGRSASLTAPNGVAQARLLHASYLEAVDPPTLIEAHATGTPLGDPIEMGALTRAIAPVTGSGMLALGCTKANVGHGESGAGMTGLLALMLVLDGNDVKPNAQLRVLNPLLLTQVSDTGVSLPTQLAASFSRPQPAAAIRPVVGVSSFGYPTRIGRATRCLEHAESRRVTSPCIVMMMPLAGIRAQSPIRCSAAL